MNPVTHPYSCGGPCSDVTPPDDDFCFPADGTFSGVSTTTSNGKGSPFETCYQHGNEAKYCWSKSHYGFHDWFECIPIGPNWHTVDPKYVNPVTNPYSCGLPCKDMTPG